MGSANPFNAGRMKEVRSIPVQAGKAATLRIAEYTRTRIPSTELRLSMKVLRVKGRGWAMYLPQYWAYYVHEGRGPTAVRPPGIRRGPDSLAIGSSKIRYFAGGRKHLDPRTAGGYPIRLTDIRFLTYEQIEALGMVMVQTTYTGPVRGSFFWTKTRAKKNQRAIMLEEVQKLLDKRVPRLFKTNLKVRIRL